MALAAGNDGRACPDRLLEGRYHRPECAAARRSGRRTGGKRRSGGRRRAGGGSAGAAGGRGTREAQTGLLHQSPVGRADDDRPFRHAALCGDDQQQARGAAAAGRVPGGHHLRGLRRRRDHAYGSPVRDHGGRGQPGNGNSPTSTAYAAATTPASSGATPGEWQTAATSTPC